MRKGIFIIAFSITNKVNYLRHSSHLMISFSLLLECTLSPKILRWIFARQADRQIGSDRAIFSWANVLFLSPESRSHKGTLTLQCVIWPLWRRTVCTISSRVDRIGDPVGGVRNPVVDPGLTPLRAGISGGNNANQSPPEKKSFRVSLRRRKIVTKVFCKAFQSENTVMHYFFSVYIVEDWLRCAT